MFSLPVKTIISLGMIGTILTGCATKTLITKDSKPTPEPPK